MKEKLEKLRKEYMAALTSAKDHWKAVQALCDEDDREPTDEERAEFDKLTETAEQLKTKFEACESDAKRSQWISDASEQASKKPNTWDGFQPGEHAVGPDLYPERKKAVNPAVARQTSKVFEDGAQAYGFFKWMRATQFGDADSAQWCRDHGVQIGAAMSTVTNAAGAATVPESFANRIINLVEDYGVFRRWSNYVPMGSETEVWPRVLTGQTVYFPAQNTAPTASDLSFDNVSLTAKELATLTLVSRTLSEDSAVAIADLVASRAANALANKEDECGFNGDGTSTYGGIFGAAVKINDGNHAGGITDAASGNTAFETLDLTDFEACAGSLPMYPGIRPAWFISQPGYFASMARLMDAAGGNTTGNIAMGTPYQFLGYPVVISQVLNSTLGADTSAIKCLFGDLRMASTMGYRRQLVFETDSGGKYFENRQTAMLMSERIDIVVHDLGDGTNAGPIVALKTASS